MADMNENARGDPSVTEGGALSSVENVKVYRVKIVHSSATEFYTCEEGVKIEPGDMVIVPTRYGKELGRVQGITGNFESENCEIQFIERKATGGDMEQFETNKAREVSAFKTCLDKIIEHGLTMKLVGAHYLIDDAKILFYFTAESRVDFRDLVKDLVAIFKMRVELRQIGVRDEARVLGGVGVCGRCYCCHSVTDKLKLVSIKMAKEQNLTLNSMKISGPCGRLLCCLAYEYNTYREIKKNLPVEGTRLVLEDEVFKVIEINLFARKVRLLSASGRRLDLDYNRFVFNKESGDWRVESSV